MKAEKRKMNRRHRNLTKVMLLRKKIFIALTVSVIIVLVSSPYWLSAYGRYLVVDEKPRKSDAIVVLAGETVPRVAKGAALYRENYGDVVIMTGGGRLSTKYTEARIMLEEAADLGVPPSAVILEDKSLSTYENAVFVKRIIMERNLKSFLLVTSSYHTRRSQYIFKKVFKDTGVEIITVSAPDPKYSPSSWWKDHEGQQKALTELANMVIYRLKY